MKNSLLRIHKKIQKSKIKSYYINHLYQGQTFSTRILNFLLIRLIVLVGAFLVFIFFTEGERIFATFAASFSVLAIYHLIASHFEKMKLEQITKQINEKIASEDFIASLKDSEQDLFSVQLKDILSKLPGFSDIQITSDLRNEGIDLLCKFKNEPLVIQCHLLDGENAVEARKARELSRAMSKRDYKLGLIISTTDFREDTRLFCEKIKEKRQIVLLARDELVQMAKDAGKLMSEEEARNYILKKIEHRERIWQSRKKFFTKSRIISYFFYGTILVLVSSMIKNFSFQNLYFLSALLLYGLGFWGIIFSLKQRDNTGSKWQKSIEERFPTD